MFCVQYFHVYETQVDLCITDEALIFADCMPLCDPRASGETDRV